jgi:hypothetical protein
MREGEKENERENQRKVKGVKVKKITCGNHKR